MTDEIPNPVARLFAAARRVLRVFESERHIDTEAGEYGARFPLDVKVYRDDLDGGWVAECVQLPGCFAQGETRDEALDSMGSAINAVLEARVSRALQEARHQAGAVDEERIKLAI